MSRILFRILRLFGDHRAAQRGRLGQRVARRKLRRTMRRGMRGKFK